MPHKLAIESWLWLASHRSCQTQRYPNYSSFQSTGVDVDRYPKKVKAHGPHVAVALLNSNHEAARLLIELEANVDVSDGGLESPLSVACVREMTGIVRIS